MEHYPHVDAWLADTPRWRDEAARLRALLLESGLDEAVKWGKPCYAHRGRNVAILQPFKEFLALMFFEGYLLHAPEGVLEEQGEHSRYVRRVCFRAVEDVEALAATVRELVREACAVAEQDVPRPADELELVAELQERLDAEPALGAAFRALTPGRQREYNLQVAGAKQAATRHARIDKLAPRILAGKGLRDR